MLFNILSSIFGNVKKIEQSREEGLCFLFPHSVAAPLLALNILLLFSSHITSEKLLTCESSYGNHGSFTDFCFSHGTSTSKSLASGKRHDENPFPGIGFKKDGVDDEISHRHYRFFPWLLISVCFLLSCPHWIWSLIKDNEYDRTLRTIRLIYEDQHMQVINKEYEIVTLLNRLICNYRQKFKVQYSKLCLCELLNLICLGAITLALNRMISGYFIEFGYVATKEFIFPDSSYYTMAELVFPIASKCVQRAIGTSGNVFPHNKLLTKMDLYVYIFYLFKIGKSLSGFGHFPISLVSDT